MATTIVLNLIASILVAAGLVTVCRLAYAATRRPLDVRIATAESAPPQELKRRAA